MISAILLFDQHKSCKYTQLIRNTKEILKYKFPNDVQKTFIKNFIFVNIIVSIYYKLFITSVIIFDAYLSVPPSIRKIRHNFFHA